jgi:hypothetical protein
VVGASGFEPPTSWSRTRRSSQAEPRPDKRLKKVFKRILRLAQLSNPFQQSDSKCNSSLQSSF